MHEMNPLVELYGVDAMRERRRTAARLRRPSPFVRRRSSSAPRLPEPPVA